LDLPNSRKVRATGYPRSRVMGACKKITGVALMRSAVAMSPFGTLRTSRSC
jgi:hypothetical protein